MPKSRKYLVELIKAAGQDIIDQADDIVGDFNMISDLSVVLSFPSDEVPTIEIYRTHFGKETLKTLRGEKQ